MNTPVAILTITKAATLWFGGTITVLSYRAYRRTDSPALWALTVGIGLVTVGAFLGGVLHHLANFSIEISATTQSVFTALGFAILTYSLYTTHPAQ